MIFIVTAYEVFKNFRKLITQGGLFVPVTENKTKQNKKDKNHTPNQQRTSD